ncbi:N-6 DNA methylase [Veillonella ratti]|uniref:N-6 DNA methylase n=1 Tax=Veillonella ratti TaxID=103892 RepID=UPI000F8CB599|nr:N-6 DNA methylase [Veillonella ratti]
MFESLFAELKLQNTDRTNEYIAKVEDILKPFAIASFQDSIFIVALTLVSKVDNSRIKTAFFQLKSQLNDSFVTKALESAADYYQSNNPESYGPMYSALRSCTALQLLTYLMFADPNGKKDAAFDSGRSLNRLLVELVKNETSIYDWGFGYGQFLLSAALYGNAQSLEGIEINPECYVVTKLRLSLLPHEPTIKLHFGNMFYEEDRHRSIFNNFRDVSAKQPHSAIIHPPFGVMIDEFFENNKGLRVPTLPRFAEIMGPSAYKSEWPFILRALDDLADEKRLYAITTNGAASTETYSEIRRNLVQQGLVECVVQLSENLLPGTNIPSILWIFSKYNETVRMIDAGEFRTTGRRKSSLSAEDIEDIIYLITNRSHVDELAPKYRGIINFVSPKELAESNYNLAPSRHLGETFPATEHIFLKDVCKINRGVLLNAQELDELVTDDNSVKYITPKNLNNNVISLTEITSLAETDEILKKKSIDDNTIVMSKLLPFKTGYVTTVENKKVFSNGNTYFLQINKAKINPLFLWMYLNSAMAKKQLDQLSRGTKTSTLSISDLKELKIPLIEPAVQDKLVDKYKKLLKKERQIQESLNTLKKEKEQLIETVL